MISERDARGVGPLDHMVICDDMSFLVPNETRAGAAWNLREVQAERVLMNGQSCNMHHRGRRLAKDGDRGFFILGQVAPRGNGSGYGVRVKPARSNGWPDAPHNNP